MKKVKGKMLAAAMALVLIVGMLPISAFAENDKGRLYVSTDTWDQSQGSVWSWYGNEWNLSAGRYEQYNNSYEIKAEPAEGFAFKEWRIYSGDDADNLKAKESGVVITENPYTVYLTNHTHAIAYFEEIEHKWEYAMNDNVLAATCSRCGQKATATLNVQDAIYDGQPHGAELVLNGWDQAGLYSIGSTVYYKQNKNGNFRWFSDNTPPVDAGVYEVHQNFLVGKIVSWIIYQDFKIEKKPITIKADDKTCADIDNADALSWTMEGEEDNWFEAEKADISLVVTDDEGNAVDPKSAPEGEYVITPSWYWYAENTNYEATFVPGTFDTRHDFGEWAVTKEAGCTEAGEETRVCSRDASHKETREIAAKGEHSPASAVKENEVPATCEADGSYEDVVYCETCGEELSRAKITVPATGHDYGEWKVTKAATEAEEGIETRVCKHDASHIVTRAIPKLDPTNVSYRNTAGDGGEWTKGSGETLDFAFKRSVDDGKTFGLFTGIEVDGKAVGEDKYMAQAGSVVVNLQPEYLETLSVGSHTIKAQFEDGSAAADFTVAEEERQPIGGNYYPVTWDPNGGTFSASTYPFEKGTEKVLQPAYKGTTLKVLAAPTRSGYTFLHWECDGKEYQPDQEFTVEERYLVFTAQWKKDSTTPTDADRTTPTEDDRTTTAKANSATPAKANSTVSSGGTSKRTTPNTGDASDPAIWLAVMFATAGLLLAGISCCVPCRARSPFVSTGM